MFTENGDIVPRVLLVDEDARFLNECTQTLQEQFHVVTALGTDQGMKALADEGPFAVVVSELNMYGTSGIQFLSRIKRSSPHGAGILLVGPDDIEAAINAVINGDAFRFLIKPFSFHLLEKSLHAGIRQYVRAWEMEKAEKGTGKTGLKKRILIADDDPDFRSFITGELRKSGAFGILTAENGRIAKTLLNTIKIDMVITDLEMPVMGGLQLLTHVRSHHPDTPVIILTWFLKKEMEESMRQLGYFQYLEKPLEPDLLMERISRIFNGEGVAQVQGISTSTFLQLIEVDEITCTLIVKQNQRVGFLYFLKGSLIDAETGNLEGEQAAYEIISWENSRIELENNCPKREKLINKTLMMILMEANRRIDEKSEAIARENSPVVKPMRISAP